MPVAQHGMAQGFEASAEPKRNRGHDGTVLGVGVGLGAGVPIRQEISASAPSAKCRGHSVLLAMAFEREVRLLRLFGSRLRLLISELNRVMVEIGIRHLLERGRAEHQACCWLICRNASTILSRCRYA